MAGERGGRQCGGPRRRGRLGFSIGSVLGILLGWSVGGTIGGPVGSDSGYIGAFLGAVLGCGVGMFLGYWIGVGIGSVTKRVTPRQRHQASHATLAGLNQSGMLAPKRRTPLGQGCAVIGLLFGLLMLFSIVFLPAIVLAIIGIGLAAHPTETFGWPGQVCGLFVAAVCLAYLGGVGYLNLKRTRPKGAAGKESGLHEFHTAQGPGTLIVTVSAVSIQRPPALGRSFPEPVIVPRAEIVEVTREARSSAASAISSFFGVMTHLTIHTRDGKKYGIEGVPIWEVRRLIRLLSQPPT